MPAGYGHAGRPPGYGGRPATASRRVRRRGATHPLIAVILAVTVLLCGGAVTAGVLVVNNVTDRAKEAIEPITNPTLPTVPDRADRPARPSPDLPTDLPTDLPNLPDLPGNSGKKITVVYEVTGDGPAEIVYTEKLGESPKRVSNAKLPWKVTTTMEGAALVSVVGGPQRHRHGHDQLPGHGRRRGGGPTHPRGHASPRPPARRWSSN